MASQSETERDQRERLAQQQNALLSALLGQGPTPDGVDPNGVWATARQLIGKRASRAATVVPELALALGSDWHGQFSRFAAARNPTGPAAEAVEFARWLSTQAEVPEPARQEAARVVSRWRVQGSLVSERPMARLSRHWQRLGLLRRRRSP